jgi:hypothetical protein
MSDLLGGLVERFGMRDNTDHHGIAVFLNFGHHAMVKVGAHEALLEIRGGECDLINAKGLDEVKITLNSL